jgi:hypothetical protein
MLVKTVHYCSDRHHYVWEAINTLNRCSCIAKNNLGFFSSVNCSFQTESPILSGTSHEGSNSPGLLWYDVSIRSPALSHLKVERHYLQVSGEDGIGRDVKEGRILS